MQELMIASKAFKIIELPGRPKALLDRTVAEIYEVETREVNQAMKNNPEKFPDDFWFSLTTEEIKALAEIKNFDLAWNGGYTPKAFTWEGCNMLATILKSDIATQRAIQIVRGFTAIEKIIQQKVDNEFVTWFNIARLIGLEGNQAIISANNAVKTLRNVDCLKILGTELSSPIQERFYNVTDIGAKLAPPRSARATNSLLATAGLQIADRSGKDLVWKLTDAGKKFGQYQDTGKKHSNGTPVQQVKWAETVIEKIQR